MTDDGKVTVAVRDVRAAAAELAAARERLTLAQEEGDAAYRAVTQAEDRQRVALAALGEIAGALLQSFAFHRAVAPDTVRVVEDAPRG